MPSTTQQHDQRDVRGRPTLEQVAARAGVSRATVSRVVNRVPSVDPHLAEIVNAAIRELNYVPNQSARALMTKRLDTVALIMAESSTRVFNDPFFASILRGVSVELGRAGVHLVLSLAQSEEDTLRVEQFLRGGHVDGAMVISEHDSLHLIARLASAGIPLIIGGRPLHATDGVIFVDNDNAGGAGLAARRLMELGRTRIGTVCGPQDMSAGVDRLAGFRAALGERFDPDLVEEGDFTTPSGAEAMERLWRRCPELDGLFVASDMMAIGAMGFLREVGRRVPEDVAVIGFDDIEMAELSEPPLTTVRQHTSEQGRLMAQVLLRELGREVPDTMAELARLTPDAGPIDHPAGGVVLDVELVVRRSA